LGGGLFYLALSLFRNTTPVGKAKQRLAGVTLLVDRMYYSNIFSPPCQLRRNRLFPPWHCSPFPFSLNYFFNSTEKRTTIFSLTTLASGRQKRPPELREASPPQIFPSRFVPGISRHPASRPTCRRPSFPPTRYFSPLIFSVKSLRGKRSHAPQRTSAFLLRFSPLRSSSAGPWRIASPLFFSSSVLLNRSPPFLSATRSLSCVEGLTVFFPSFPSFWLLSVLLSFFLRWTVFLESSFLLPSVPFEAYYGATLLRWIHHPSFSGTLF